MKLSSSFFIFLYYFYCCYYSSYSLRLGNITTKISRDTSNYISRGLSISNNLKFVLFTESVKDSISYLNLSSNEIIPFVGNISGYLDDIGTNSQFLYPQGICISNNNQFALVADTDNFRIRYITISTKVVTTLAGGMENSETPDGIGTNSFFWAPVSISISSDDSFALVIESYTQALRHIVISTAVVTTLLTVNPLIVRVCISPDNKYALVSGGVITKIILSTKEKIVIAGSDTNGYQDGIGTNAIFNHPIGLSISPDGSYALIIDSVNNMIRHLDISTSNVTTFAGSLTYGKSDGIGTNAGFYRPVDIDISSDGIFGIVADTRNKLIRYFTINPPITFQPTLQPTINYISNSNSNDNNNINKNSIIIGVVIGGFFGILLIFSFIYYCFIYHSQSNPKEIILPQEPQIQSEPQQYSSQEYTQILQKKDLELNPL